MIPPNYLFKHGMASTASGVADRNDMDPDYFSGALMGLIMIYTAFVGREFILGKYYDEKDESWSLKSS
jgi:hypothetical protein